MAERHQAGAFSAATSGERARIREAAMALVVERGYDGTTIEAVVERAGVDRTVFERYFADLGDCCMQIYLANIAEFNRVVFGMGDGQGAWRDRLRAVAYAAARYVQDRPLETRFDMIQMLVAGDMAQAHRDRYVQRIVDLVDEGRQELEDPDSIGRGVAEGVFGSIYEFIVREVQAGRGTRSAEAFVPDLMYIAVRPYLGHDVAREELGIPAPLVAMDERERICEAMIDVVLEHGYEDTTVALVVERAGVDDDAFYRHFADKAGCFMEIFQQYVDVFEGRVSGAFEREDEWRDALRAAAYAAAGYIRDYPRQTRFGVTGVLGAGPVPQAHSGNFLQGIVDLIDAGRRQLDDPESMSRGVAEGALGSIYESLLRELQKGDVKAPEDYIPELMYIAVRPYLGHDVAREELSMPPPPVPAEGEEKRGNKCELKADTPIQSDGSHRYRPGVAKRKPSGEKTPPGLSRLPPGRHGLSREFVTQNQRDRLTAGMIATVAEYGYHEATISQIAEAAGVSRRTFYGYFSGKEECFFATYELIAEHLQTSAKAAAEPQSEWPEQVRARLASVLETFAANPDLVRFTMMAPQAAGGKIADRYRAEMDRALSILIEGIPPGARHPSAAAEQGLLGAVAALIGREVRAGQGERLPELLPDLLELVLAPYLGREEAVRAARR